MLLLFANMFVLRLAWLCASTPFFRGEPAGACYPVAPLTMLAMSRAESEKFSVVAVFATSAAAAAALESLTFTAGELSCGASPVLMDCLT